MTFNIQISGSIPSTADFEAAQEPLEAAKELVRQAIAILREAGITASGTAYHPDSMGMYGQTENL